MQPSREPFSTETTWSNGRKAVVDLLRDRHGKQVIRKIYRVGFRTFMFREYMMAAYASRRLSIVPRVVAFKPWRNEMYLEYMPGERVLEWVLRRFGATDLRMSDFHSFNGLNPPHQVDVRVADAFAGFRASTSDEARQLRRAIQRSYASLHRIGVKHGSADPRNMLYDENRVYIIDFDNARPSLNPERIDYEELEYWYGLRPASD